MTELPFSLERAVLIRARVATVFAFFTDSERFAAWWGPGSTIEARPGGRVVIRYPGGSVASGEVISVNPPHEIAFTFGYEGEGKPIPPGGSRVTVSLREEPGGTLVRLRHDVATQALRDEHAPGWRFQLSLFAVAASRVASAGAVARIDAWYKVWAERDPAARRALLEGAVAPDITLRDRFACIQGVDDLDAHIVAAQHHMPASLTRDGDPRICHGFALSRWRATRAGGGAAGQGENLFELDPDGKIASVVGFWDGP
jgi:uncharacterized protein YndB with AHSA1/START domain